MTVEEYALLITEQNYQKEKFMDYVRSVLTLGINNSSVIDSMPMAFSIGNAAGEQLDIIGSLVGVSRILPVVPSVGTREMSDDEYLMCIRMKTARNVWDGTNESARRIYHDVLGETMDIYYTDNQNMTVTITISGTETVREAEVLFLTDTLLVPAGVKANPQIIDSNIEYSIKIGTNIYGQLVCETVRMIPRGAGYKVGVVEQMYVGRVQRFTVSELQG